MIFVKDKFYKYKKNIINIDNELFYNMFNI